MRWLVLAVALAASAPVAATAQPYDVPETWGGDLWSRPRLTGDWFGFRDEMGKRGVVLDLDLLQILQGTATGGRNTGVAYGGTAEYTLNVDTGKLGLWPGGFLNVYAMSGFANNENSDAGGKLALQGIGPATIVFSDRPKRLAGHMDTKEFVATPSPTT